MSAREVMNCPNGYVLRLICRLPLEYFVKFTGRTLNDLLGLLRQILKVQ